MKSPSPFTIPLLGILIGACVIFVKIRQSDKLAEEKQAAQALAREQARWEKPKTPIPRPSGSEAPIHFFEAGSSLAAEFQYKLVVYEKPDGIRLQPAPPSNHHAWPFQKNGDAFPLDQLKEKKTLSFKYPHFPIYWGEPPESPNLFVCTWLLKDFNNQCQILPENPSGSLGQFCGIVSVAGDVVFQFPIEQQRPGRLAQPLRMKSDGRKAAVAIGELVTDNADCGYEGVGKIKEVLVWEYPNKVRRLSGDKLPSNDVQDLMVRFDRGQL